MKNIIALTRISKPYVVGIRKCTSIGELKKFVYRWKEFAKDALDAVNDKSFDYLEFRQGMAQEEEGNYSGDKWTKKYGAILLPKIIIFIGMKASQLNVPEGLVLIRCVENDLITKDKDGFYCLDETKL